MVIAPLDRKLLRNLSEMKGQVATIALVVAAGISAYVATKTTYASLITAQEAFYEDSRFADVWAQAERVPDRRLADIRAIPGVSLAISTVSGPVTMPLPERTVPATGLVQSLPEPGEPALNLVRLDAGRMPEPTRNYEVLVSEAFAQANELEPGDELPAILNGRRRTLRIVGVAVSPEHTISISPGAFTVDSAGYGVLFMNRRGVAAAFDLEGSFNTVALDIEPGASEPEVIARLDRLLEPYGGAGAIPRAKQMSHFFLSQELMQLDNMATTVPPIFLAVAAFLLNVVLGRLVQLQRGQIAALKALGYTNGEIGMHFLKLATVVVTIGAVLGLAIGKWLGVGMVSLYTEFFRFPELAHELDPATVATALGVSAGSGIFGTLFVVRRILKLAPAEAMQPPAPGRYRRGFFERFVPSFVLGPLARMVYRDMRRRPLRLAFSVLGIAAGIGINVVGLFFDDAMTYLVDGYMHDSMRWDVQVALREPASDRAVREMAAFPYVLRAEANRTVPVRVTTGHRERDVVLRGYPSDGTLTRVLDMEGRPVAVPERGVMITELLAERLELELGDRVTFELRQGDRRTVEAPVTALIDEAIGLNMHATNDTIEELIGTTPLADSVLLTVEPGHEDEVIARLREEPLVFGIVRKEAIIQQFRDQSSDQMQIFTLVFIIATTVIVVGVVYNNARVTLSTKERELASMRVLGFTRAEISLVLIGELAVHVLLAIPIGLWLGAFWSEGIANMSDPEQYRLPVMISARTYAFSTVVAIAAATVSALLVRRKLYRLDLTAVLKSRE